MTRKLVSGFAAFALIAGASMTLGASSAEAGLFGKRCGGGIFSKLFAKKSACAPAPSCCMPEPTCCEPAPTCCEPEPTCCEPAPTCCEPEPTCCEPAPVAEPCCGTVTPAPVVSDCCGGTVMGESIVEGGMMTAPMMEGTVTSGDYNLAPGETLVPGSVQTIEGSEAPVMDAPMDETAPAAPSVESSSDVEPAPPAPTSDDATDA